MKIEEKDPEHCFIDLSNDRDEIKEINLPKINVVLDEKAFMPDRAHAQDAGADLFTPVDITIDAGQTVFIDTGVHIEVPDGYVLELKEKSGLAKKHGIQVLGGIIDAGYTGSIGAILKNNFSEPCSFEAGDKICQFLIYKIETPSFILVDKFDNPNTERADGGFGSTSSK